MDKLWHGCVKGGGERAAEKGGWKGGEKVLENELGRCWNCDGHVVEK